MKVSAPSLAPILRSDAQGRILARVLANPEASYSLSDLVTWSGTSMPTVLREIGRAEQAGIVTTEKVGPTRLVRANVAHPLHDALRRIILATYGPPAVIADEFEGIDGAETVVLFGSWAARYLGQPGRMPNDIDVLVIGSADRDAVDEAAERAERRIGLPVQATVRSRAQWDTKRESFIREVRSRPLVPVLIGDDSSLATDLRHRAGDHRQVSWERGRADIDRLIAEAELERVTPSEEVARRLVADASAHIALASMGVGDDPAGALQLSYDAARKASAALLAIQGLRATTRGGHIAVFDAVRAQFNERGGMAVFGRLHALRRRRNRTEYPDLDSAGVNEDDAQQALDTARATLDAAKRLLDSGQLEPFE